MKLYYQFSDNADVSNIVMPLEDCIEWIKSDMEGLDENSKDIEYTITPIWMTEKEYEKLPEACL
jgi:hypothetical protein